MVAYSFQPRFVEPIRAGTKRQTIRSDRKRHARPGEAMQLYTGMRTRSCRLIGTATCEAVEPIRIWVAGEVIECGIAPTFRDRDLSEFARSDGFADWEEMRDFWRQHHPDVKDVWSGWLIRWRDFTAPEGGDG